MTCKRVSSKLLCIRLSNYALVQSHLPFILQGGEMISLPSIVLFPDTIRQTFDIESLQVFIRVKAFWIIVKLVIISIASLSLLVVVIHVVHGVKLFNWILLIILLHHFQIHLVVNLESLELNLLSPSVVVDLHVV